MVLNISAGGITPTSDTGIASYSFSDIASGTGIITFYAGEGGSTPSKILSSTKFYSSTYITSLAVGAGDGSASVFTKLIDIDFDVLMNRQITLRGDVAMNVSVAFLSGSIFEIYTIIKIRKWDGTTETDLSTSGQSETVTFTGTSPTVVYKYTTPIVKTPSSIIKKDEYLRMTVELWYKKQNAGDAAAAIKVAYDPYARTTDWDTTGGITSQLIVPIPMKVVL